MIASDEMGELARSEGCSAEFEERIAECMNENGVSYFGRLVMVDDEGNLVTASRYGSVAGAHKGTAVRLSSPGPTSLDPRTAGYASE